MVYITLAVNDKSFSAKIETTDIQNYRNNLNFISMLVARVLYKRNAKNYHKVTNIWNNILSFKTPVMASKATKSCLNLTGKRKVSIIGPVGQKSYLQCIRKALCMLISAHLI